MQFRVLGSLEVLTDVGDAIGLGGATQRRLLAALLVDAGAVVSADRLCDVMEFGESALHTAVSRLRRALGGSAVITQPPGYRLDATTIDAAEFERLCRNARGEPPAESLQRLEAALALWRGEPYAEFADEPWAHPEAVRLAELRADAVEDRAEALVALGRYGEAVAGLERHMVGHPLRDRPCELMMRALAAQGRQTEALRAYQDHYRYLADELGTQPSLELVELERLIASGWHDEAPEPARQPTRTNLPILLTSFVGRADEITRLRGVLGDHRLLTLVGPGGIGKTRLAVELAATIADRFSDGVWLVELAPLDDPAGVPQMIASTLAVPETAHRTLTEDIVAFLHSQATLVILDNCEHVIDAAAAAARAIATGCPSVTVLTTSREGLAIDGERVWPVAPLDAGNDAIQLFADRASEVAPRFEPENHRDAIEEICRRLDGIPLAIELAATRIQSLAPADIARLLDDRFRLLTAGRRSSRERHRSLRATVEWSFDLLEEGEQLLFARLSVFSGWFDLSAAQAIAGGAPLDPFGVVDGLERLVEQSMVAVEDRPAGRRYRLLETLRQFGLERLALVGVDAVTERHAHHHRDWIERLRDELRGPDELHALADLDDGWDNLRAAHLWAVDRNDTDTALRISAALVWECWWRHRFEASAWARVAVELPDAADHPALVEALVTVAQTPMIQFHVEEYAAAVDRATEANRHRGGPAPMSLVMAQASVEWFTGRGDHAELIGQNIHEARRRHDLETEAQLLADAAYIERTLGRDDAARRRAREALEVARRTGNPTLMLWADQQRLGHLTEPHDQLPLARELVARAEQLRNQMSLFWLPGFLSVFEVRSGATTPAVTRFRQLLLRMLSTEAWWSWAFVGFYTVSVLAGAGAYRSAAIVIGQLGPLRAADRFNAGVIQPDVDLITSLLPAAELAGLMEQGADLSPREAGELVLAELDTYLAEAAQAGSWQT